MVHMVLGNIKKMTDLKQYLDQPEETWNEIISKDVFPTFNAVITMIQEIYINKTSYISIKLLTTVTGMQCLFYMMSFET